MLTPILIISYNRPQHLRQLIGKLTELKNPIFVFNDGPLNTSEDKEKVLEVRRIIQEAPINGFLYSEVNLGCQLGVETAIDWIFEQFEEAIILEDDIEVNESFFPYIEELLKKYRSNTKIGMISACKLVDMPVNDYSYFFSRYSAIWGWATWKRSWSNYMKTKKMFLSSNQQNTNLLKEKLGSKIYTLGLQASRGKIDTWDYIWRATLQFHDQYCICPSKNLVKNLGFGPAATHTKLATRFAFLRQEALNFPLLHPPYIIESMNYDKKIEKLNSKLYMIFDLLKIALKRNLEILKNLYYLFVTVKNSWLVLALRMGWKSKSEFLILKLWSGYKIKIRSTGTDYHEVISVLSGKDYPLEKFKDSLPKNPVIVDVGAFIGDFVLYVSAFFPKAKIYALEPHPISFQLLRENIQLNHLNDVSSLQLAVGKQSGICTFRLEENANESSLDFSETNNTTFKTLVTTLPSLIRDQKIKHIHLLKIDCEGCEYQLIKNFISDKKMDMVVLEYHQIQTHTPEELINFFVSNNYQILYQSENINLNSGILWFGHIGLSGE